MFGSKDEKNIEADIISSSNTIGKGTTLYGDIETHGNLRIEGNIEGNVKTKSKIVLGKSSEVIGNIKAQNAEIEGTVTGKIDVSEILILKKTSVIKGNISTGRLIVEPGSQFNGGCKMGKLHTVEKEDPKPSTNITADKETFKEPQKAGTI